MFHVLEMKLFLTTTFKFTDVYDIGLFAKQPLSTFNDICFKHNLTANNQDILRTYKNLKKLAEEVL